ncbi:MAG TPA: S8 family serine peptidase [Planctomycetota bacterium]
MSSYTLKEYVAATDEFVFRVPDGMHENAAAGQLLASGLFQYVEPDWTVYPIGCPNDPLLGSQWQHDANRMDSCAGWDLHSGNPSVAVDICDTGVRTTHEDLQANRLEGYNAVDRVWENSGGNIGPVHPHGTMTTGCAAANGNNGKGVVGMGWNLSHRMMRVSNSSGGGASLSDLQHAARTSVENGDRVPSVSYSGVDPNSNLTTATYIKSIGGLLVWAAGNDGRNLTFGNRDNDDIIVAGATTSSDSKASFSAYGNFVDLTAPGQSVLTTDSGSDSDYASVSGTSFACPMTAGLCALIWSADPSLTPDQVEALLKATCDDLGSAGVDSTYGYGRIDVHSAMLAATGGSGGNPPVANFVGTPTSGTEPLTVAFTDTSTGGAATSWSWSFGDGNTSTSQNPGNTYTTAGTYTVSLTATNATGSDQLIQTGYITVTGGGGGGNAIVDCISYQTIGGRRNDRHLNVTIKIVDDANNPVAGASVSATIHGPKTNSFTLTTDALGQVTYRVKKANNGCYTTDVTAVSAAGLSFDGTEPTNGFQKNGAGSDTDCRGTGDGC